MSTAQRAPLFLCVAPSGLEPTLSEFRAAMGERPFDVFDIASDSGSPDFSGRRAVVDLGGWGRREDTSRAHEAGVELWHVLGYGLDHLDLQYLLKQGITVAHTPGPASAVSLAEHAVLLMLACARKFNEQQANLRSGDFWHPWTHEIAGKRLLLLGVGASGRELARRASAFGMEVAGIDVVAPSEAEQRATGIIEVRPPDALHEMLGWADVVSLHLPLTNDTHHVLDAQAFGAMKQGAIVVNVARGALIDEQALRDALDSGRVGAAGLDVFEHEQPGHCPDIAGHPHVVATPHTAGVAYETVQRRARIVVDNLDRLVSGEPILFQVSRNDDFVLGAPAH
jgi:phosphoglycerate dehydrogenase-like enzyme